MKVHDESPECVVITERSTFTSDRGRLIIWAIAQLALLLCIPLWTSGKVIEALVLGFFWTLGTCWFCGAQTAVSIDGKSRTLRRFRHVFGLTLFSRLYSVVDGDGLCLILRLDGEDAKGILKLYLQHCDRNFYLLDLPSDAFKQSSQIIAQVQTISDLLRIYNYGYR